MASHRHGADKRSDLDDRLREAGRLSGGVGAGSIDAVLDLAIALSDPGVRSREEAARRRGSWWGRRRLGIAGGTLAIIVALGGLTSPALGLPGWVDLVSPSRSSSQAGVPVSSDTAMPRSPAPAATSGSTPAASASTAAPPTGNPQHTTDGFQPPATVSATPLAVPLPGAGPWLLDKNDPRIFTLTESLYPEWLPLPSAYTRADVIKAQWKQFYPAEGDVDGVSIDGSSVEAHAEHFATCAWYQDYLDALEQNDPAGQRLAAAQIAKTPGWQGMADELPEEESGYYQSVADAVAAGDPGPMVFNQGKMNCPAVLVGEQW